MKQIILVFLLSLSPFIQASTEVKYFETDSYNKIKKHYKKNFLFVLWSLDCPPCIKELKTLGDYAEQHADFNLVLVSTDSPSRLTETLKMLKRFDLDNKQVWIFSSDTTLALRYSIDPLWYGELPRSYYFDDTGSRFAMSGAVETNQLDSWFNSRSYTVLNN